MRPKNLITIIIIIIIDRKSQEKRLWIYPNLEKWNISFSFILFRKIKLFKVLSNLIIVATCIEQFEIWKILYTWNPISKFPNI